MKIAIVSTIHNAISPAFSGGIEVFNASLLKELTRRGHDVTIFASGESKVEGKLYPVCPQALFQSGIDPNESQGMRKLIYLENHYYIQTIEYIKKNNFDIIHHSHTSFLPMYLAYKAQIPQILTIHMTANSNITLNQDLTEIFHNNGEIGLISISKRQEEILNDLKFFKNVYNGINLENLDYNKIPEDYFAWLGRIAPNKGTKEAVEIALKADVKLKLAGDIGVGKVVTDYFAQIKPFLENKKIEFLGKADAKLRNSLLGGAKALLFPIQWEEPFGLVMIEAMACGTPVIAFNLGAVSEIVVDGKTGFIIAPGDQNAMAEAIKKINNMPEDEYRQMRQNCRKHIEDNFTIEKMVNNYEQVYKEILIDWSNKTL